MSAKHCIFINITFFALRKIYHFKIFDFEISLLFAQAKMLLLHFAQAKMFSLHFAQAKRFHCILLKQKCFYCFLHKKKAYSSSSNSLSSSSSSSSPSSGSNSASVSTDAAATRILFSISSKSSLFDSRSFCAFSLPWPKRISP